MATIYVKEETLPKAWEASVLRAWEEGDEVKTEYDKSEDPPSRDANALIHVIAPQQEPRIHKAFPGGLDDLESYRLEVVHGIHNHWIPEGVYGRVTEIGKKLRSKQQLSEEDKKDLKESTKWSYTYHQRLFAYDTPDGKITNQIEEVIEKLVEAPHSRRAVVSLLKPWSDIFHFDPPCFNLAQFRVWGDKLRMHLTMRSNDAFKASFMNMWAFTDLQRYVAEEVSKRLRRIIAPGDYTQNSISYHICGKDFEGFRDFLESIKKRESKERVWDSGEEIVQSFFASGRRRELEWRGDKELPPDKKLIVYNQMSDEEKATLPIELRRELEGYFKNP